MRAETIQHFAPASPTRTQLVPVMMHFYHCCMVLLKSFWQPTAFHSQQTNITSKNALLILINCPHHWQHQRRSKTEPAKEGEIFSNCKGGTEAHGRKSLSYFYTEGASAARANSTSTLSKFSGKNNLNLIKKRKSDKHLRKLLSSSAQMGAQAHNKCRN